jgi:hypothetical protein
MNRALHTFRSGLPFRQRPLIFGQEVDAGIQIIVGPVDRVARPATSHAPAAKRGSKSS